ncbi:Hypothetical predicted protein, partial [Olea europaea subsp. europaea]
MKIARNSTSGHQLDRSPPPVDYSPQTDPNHSPNLTQTTIQKSKFNPEILGVAKPVQQNPIFADSGVVRSTHGREPHGLNSSSPSAPCAAMGQPQFRPE